MAIDAGSAVGYLDLDITGFLKNLKTAQSEANDTVNNMATDIGNKMQGIGKQLSSVGTTMTAAITTPIVGAGVAAVKQFANLEQSVGGVETLFKDSAKTVIDNSETAYKRAGVDANNYMEQVTSFSATLLQGLGGDTKKAAEYADKAIVDMSDNANKMGTDIGMIQNAYQGFAKDNYTMLDNLKLGYGGTQEEMARLVNDSGVLKGKFKATADNVKDIPFDVIIEAIHKIQENLGITGTTAKEAEGTVTGSFEMMRSSVFNFLQQLGNPNADMDKFSKAMIDSIGIFVDNVKRVLSTIWDNLPISPLQKKLLVAVTAFAPILLVVGKLASGVGTVLSVLGKMPSAIDKAKTGFGAFKTGVLNIKEAVDLSKAGFPAMAKEASKFGAAIGGISAPMVAIGIAIGLLIGAFATLWKTNEDFRFKMELIWFKIHLAISDFCNGIVERINALGFDFENITDVLKTIWQGFCDLLAPVFVYAFNLVADTLKAVLDVLTGIFDVFIGIFTGNWEQAWTGVKEIFSAVWEWIKDIFFNVLETLKGILDAVCGWFKTTWESTWNNIKEFFSNTWNNIKEFFATTAENIKNGFKSFIDNVIKFFKKLPYNIGFIIGLILASVAKFVIDMVEKAKELGKKFVDAIVNFFKTLPSKVKEFFYRTTNNAKEFGTNMKDKAVTTGKNFVNSMISFVKNLPSNMKNIFLKTVDALISFSNTMREKAVDCARNTFNSIVNGLISLPDRMLEIGSNIVQGIWNGICNMGDWLYNQVASFASGIVDGMMAALGIHSPSTVARDKIGKFLPMGIGEGFKEQLPDTIKNMKNNLDKNLDKFKGNLDTLKIKAIEIIGGDDIDIDDFGGIGNSGFDYQTMALYLLEVLKKAPINIPVTVEMEDGDIIMDKERVGRKVAPVVSRVLAQ